MIILPDRNLSRGKLLMPLPKREWMPPSRAQKKTFCGDEDRTRFRLKAKAHDGYAVWVGWFENRNDADAFLFALVSGSLHCERELWRLPTPEWHPGISTDLVYEFVTQTILLTTGSNQTYTSPSDWNNASNQIECLGGGGSGGRMGSSTAGHPTGGGGAAYSLISNFTFASPGTTQATYRVAAQVGGQSGTTTVNGTDGEATWFNDTVNPGSGSSNAKCSAAGGLGGTTGTGSRNGGAGGAASASWGQTKYDGGRGGNLTGASGLGGSGGGGSAGPSGAGGNGVDSSSTSTVQTAGGSANNGTTAGGSATNNGSGGNEFATNRGCGSGGGGAAGTFSRDAGNGGNYGGGGGAAGAGSTANSGAGMQGLIVIEYTPAATRSLANNNLPMMGM